VYWCMLCVRPISSSTVRVMFCVLSHRNVLFLLIIVLPLGVMSSHVEHQVFLEAPFRKKMATRHASLLATTGSYGGAGTQSARQPADTTHSHKNWFQRMGDAFWAMIIGIILVICSIPIMWMNERRSARYESLVNVGQSECSSVGAERVDAANRGHLVHMKGALAQGMESLQDDRFGDLQMKGGCLRLRSKVPTSGWSTPRRRQRKIAWAVAKPRS